MVRPRGDKTAKTSEPCAGGARMSENAFLLLDMIKKSDLFIIFISFYGHAFCQITRFIYV